MTILQAANNGGERREHDFYPTPPECTWAILPKLAAFPRTVWEPACGDGGIALELEADGFEVFGTDIAIRSYGAVGIDFLTTETRCADAIVTNPPFGGLASPFVAHALDLGVPYIAMLFNVNYWHAAKRTALWARRAPEAVYALAWKPDFTGAGRPYFNCIWTVWGPRSAERTTYARLAKPQYHPAIAGLLY